MKRAVAFLLAWPVALTIACGGPGGGESAGPAEEDAPADACAALSQDEIERHVGNPVLNGEPYAGPEVCHWNTESPELISVLLTMRAKGSIREEVLCSGLRETGGEGERLPGPGEVAVWKFSAGSLFNSGDLEACGPRGFVAISLNGKADESKLKQAAVELAGRVLGS